VNKLTLSIVLLVVLLVGFWLGKQHSKMCPGVSVVEPAVAAPVETAAAQVPVEAVEVAAVSAPAEVSAEAEAAAPVA
jgi:hypothetical protein